MLLRSYLDEMKISDDQNSVVVGSLLGDGSLISSNNKKWHFAKTQSKFDKDGEDKSSYLFWHFDFLKPLSMSLSSGSTKSFGSDFPNYRFRTHCHSIFGSLAKDWYKNDGANNWLTNELGRKIKIVPVNIKLTTLSLCVWLMDDGFCYAKDANAMLCTHGFTKDEVAFLVERLVQDLGIHCKIRIVKQHWKGIETEKPVIYIGRKSYFDMIEMIRPHVSWDCFKYKLDTTTYNKVDHRGETHSLAKLTENQVRLIFEMREKGMLHQEIADQLGVSKVSITMILNGKRWSHLNLSANESSKKKKPHLNKETKLKIISLHKQGKSQSEIAKIADINQSTVCRILKKESSAPNRISTCPAVSSYAALQQ